MNKKVTLAICAAILAVAAIFLEGRERKLLIFPEFSDSTVTGYLQMENQHKPVLISRNEINRILSRARGSVNSKESFGSSDSFQLKIQGKTSSQAVIADNGKISVWEQNDPTGTLRTYYDGGKLFRLLLQAQLRVTKE